MHDPYCDASEAKNEYGITLTELEKVPEADAIILAVAHRPFIDWTFAQWKKLLPENSVLLDIKGIAPLQEMENAKIRVWRL